MTTVDATRRSLVQAIGALMACGVLPFDWADVVSDAEAAHAASPAGDGALSFFTAAEAADVEAVVAQIIPTDDTPGAREAGVVGFIDRALATYFSQIGGGYRAQLAQFQAAFRHTHPDAASFASFASDRQVEYLRTVDRTPFFETTRLLTLLGMFSLPAYGGNRSGIGWALLGFEDRHVFRPPFGYYDRGYTGFVADWERAK